MLEDEDDEREGAVALDCEEHLVARRPLPSLSPPRSKFTLIVEGGEGPQTSSSTD